MHEACTTYDACRVMMHEARACTAHDARTLGMVITRWPVVLERCALLLSGFTSSKSSSFLRVSKWHAMSVCKMLSMMKRRDWQQLRHVMEV